ncbi:hypothetical protein CPB83DRAFT_932671, partial [Crepidotus variabilis]
IDSSQLLKFQAMYGSLLKASMTTLRKRDKKRERTRQDEATKRKQKMTASMIRKGKEVKRDSQKKFQEREEEERKKADIALYLRVHRQRDKAYLQRRVLFRLIPGAEIWACSIGALATISKSSIALVDTIHGDHQACSEGGEN